MTYYDLVTEIKRLSPAEQLRLLAEISQSLAGGQWPLAVSTDLPLARQELLRLAGSLPAEDAAQMRAAVEEACEQVNANEW
jgi:hypothetical protein